MFIDNKYSRWYFRIIENAKQKLGTRDGVYNARDKYGRSLGILAWLPQSGDPERLDEALITSGLAFPRSS